MHPARICLALAPAVFTLVACAASVTDVPNLGLAPDAGSEPAPDAPSHPPPDAHPPLDATRDAPQDARPDAAVDSAADATVDVPVDVAPDVNGDAVGDGAPDVLAADAEGGADTGSDGGPDDAGCVVSFPAAVFVQEGGVSTTMSGAGPTGSTVIAPASNILNLDFGSTTTTKAGVAAAGSSATDFWNAAGPGFQTDYVIPNLRWADGTTGSVTMRAQNLPGNWGASSALGDPMYDNYGYSWGGATATITFVNLQPGTYDFFVYASVTSSNTGSSVSSCAGGTSTPFQYTSTTAFNSDTTWIAGDEYSLHSGVVVLASDVVTVNLVNGSQGPGNAGILVNGIQVVRH